MEQYFLTPSCFRTAKRNKHTEPNLASSSSSLISPSGGILPKSLAKSASRAPWAQAAEWGLRQTAYRQLQGMRRTELKLFVPFLSQNSSIGAQRAAVLQPSHGKPFAGAQDSSPISFSFCLKSGVGILGQWVDKASCSMVPMKRSQVPGAAA